MILSSFAAAELKTLLQEQNCSWLVDVGIIIEGGVEKLVIYSSAPTKAKAYFDEQNFHGYPLTFRKMSGRPKPLVCGA